jgi:hypothetical protein
MTRRTLAALLIACALFLAACGDDSGSDSENAGTEQTDDGGDSQDAGDSDGDGPQSDLDGYFTGECADAVGAFNDAIASAGTAITGGPDDATLEDTAAQLEAVADAAPDEISDDFGVLADAYAEFAQVLADAGIDLEDPSSFQDPDAVAALQSVGDIFGGEELEQASTEIEAWFTENCG